ncbi:MAG: hypothetical protein F6K56_08525, partial [Moorea sp. SIO3G5]|nr:hypothetical protein [Moorena sp. SIO3G5]
MLPRPTSSRHFAGSSDLEQIAGDRSAETFKKLWKIIKCWHSFWYATDKYVVYQMFIDDIEHLTNKTYMTRSDAARSWGASAVLGVSPMSNCRGAMRL